MNNKFKKLRAAADAANTNLRYAIAHCAHSVRKDGEYARCVHCGNEYGQWMYYDYPKNFPRKVQPTFGGYPTRPARRRVRLVK